MGIVLAFVLVVSGIITLCVIYGDKTDTVIGSIVAPVIATIIICAIIGKSYGSYIDIRTQYDATLMQYKGAITMYDDKVHIDVEKAALVDFRYQGYQKSMSSFIKDLRGEIVKYNKELISKRIMDKHFLFSWVIIAPDKDMKIINMVE